FENIDPVPNLGIASCDHTLSIDFLVVQPHHNFQLRAHLEGEHGLDVTAAEANFTGRSPHGGRAPGVAQFQRTLGLDPWVPSTFLKTVGSHSSPPFSRTRKIAICRESYDDTKHLATYEGDEGIT